MLDHLDAVDDVELFYTYNVLMHFDEPELDSFFRYLATRRKPIVGIVDEPYSTDAMSKIYKQRDYAHNFVKYCERHGLTLVDSHMKNEHFGIFYFTNQERIS